MFVLPFLVNYYGDLKLSFDSPEKPEEKIKKYTPPPKEEEVVLFEKPAKKKNKGYGGDPVFSRSRFKSVADTLKEIPVISAALGPVAGLPAARFVASHFRVMTKKTAQLLVAGPAVVELSLIHI